VVKEVWGGGQNFKEKKKEYAFKKFKLSEVENHIMCREMQSGCREGGGDSETYGR